jgi:hypothetical protein
MLPPTWEMYVTEWNLGVGGPFNTSAAASMASAMWIGLQDHADLSFLYWGCCAAFPYVATGLGAAGDGLALFAANASLPWKPEALAFALWHDVSLHPARIAISVSGDSMNPLVALAGASSTGELAVLVANPHNRSVSFSLSSTDAQPLCSGAAVCTITQVQDDDGTVVNSSSMGSNISIAAWGTMLIINKPQVSDRRVPLKTDDEDRQVAAAASSAAAASCTRLRASTLSGCWVWDLSTLPSGPFNLTGGHVDEPLVRERRGRRRAPGCRYEAGIDFIGGTMRTVHSGMTRDACCQLCWSVKGCGAAVYGDNHACWLKSAAVVNHTKAKDGVTACRPDPHAPPAPPAPPIPPPSPSPSPSPSRGPLYLVSSPCANVPPAAITAVCHKSTLPTLVPAVGYALNGCLDLGLLTHQSVAAIDGNASNGVRIVYGGGNDTVGCRYPRSLIYDILCDKSVPSSAVPQPTITSKQCEYTVTWRTPLGCPKPVSDPSGCPLQLPLPTPAQMAYQRAELVATVGFQMDTYAFDDGDPGCNAKNWNSGANTSAVSTLAPSDLNTTQWAKILSDYGAKYAWADAKHGCGFLLFPTNTTLPGGIPYHYSVGGAGALGRDVVAEFRSACEAVNIKPGYYYSLKDNFFLNVVSARLCLS